MENKVTKQQKTKSPDKEKNNSISGERIAKVIARSGYCSRREAEKLIEEGEVKVNGKVITSPAINVTDESIKIKNKLLAKKEPTKVWLFHKPKGVITTHNDPDGRVTVFSLLPSNMSRVISIGRLDMNTEGLLLLTNNGELARYIELPSTGWTRTYRARVYGKLNIDKLKYLQEKGVTIDGVHYSPMKIEVEKEGTNSWLKISINEGKNREVKKVLAHYDLQVTRLIRVSFGCFHLGKLQPGELKAVPASTLKNMLGNKFGL